jgi:probable rRNA maturation factor
LEKLAEAVMEAEGCHPEAELSVVIGDDGWIQDLNQAYRKKERPTDVLAFPQDQSPAGTAPLLGDVAISAETAARQAKQVGHSFEEELALLLAHGILHLTGWTDETAAKRKRMMDRAQELVGRMGPGGAKL